MKPISETRAIEKLHRLTADFAARIREGYEHRAKDCGMCATPGACCLDAHFVNVRVTRLEAAAIRGTIATLDAEKQDEIADRIDNAIDTYRLTPDADAASQTYACPLFEKGVGCLVHDAGKPSPCIAHACYENKADLPPDDLLAEQEARIERLNELTYRMPASRLPIPLALVAANRT